MASLVLVAFAMMASVSYQRTGFFTPLHHIASVFAAPTALMSSMAEAAAGHPFALTVVRSSSARRST